MKVMQINCVFKEGSTGKITYDLHTALKEKGVESLVLYGRGGTNEGQGVKRVCGNFYGKLNNLRSRITGLMYGGCFFSTNKIIREIKREKPDIVHLQCINGYFVNIYRLVNWLKKNKVKTVLTLHAEFMYTANCGHAFDCENFKTGCGNCPRLRKETGSYFIDGTARSFKKMKKAFHGFNDNLTVTSVSPWLMERAKLSPILADKNHTVVMNGLDTRVFYPRKGEEIRQKYNLQGKKFVLFVTPIFNLQKNHIKGAWYLLELARLLPQVVFGIVGAREEIENLPENVINIGRLDNQELLAEYYSAADLTVLLSQRETFSMVLAESLCCGTPVVGFKAGGPESIAIEEFSSFVEYGDLDGLKAAVEERLARGKAEETAIKAAEKYEKSKLAQDFYNVYKELMRPKVMQINVVYNKGSTGKITRDIHTELRQKGFDSVVCYGRGKRIKSENVSKVCTEVYAKFNNFLSRITGLMYGGCYFSTKRLIKEIEKQKPDIVHLQCINGYFVNIYRLIEWLKENKVNTVLTLHAEFMYTANCGYALDCDGWKTGCGNCPRRFKETKSILFDGTSRSFKRMKRAFDGFGNNLTVVSVSNWIMQKAKASPIFADKRHRVIYNGIDTELFSNHEELDVKEKFNIRGDKIVLHATPYFSDETDHLKGGCYILELAKRLEGEKVQIVIAGKIEKHIEFPENVTALGRIGNQKILAELYKAADVAVITSIMDNYPTVCLEANCCGTPMIGFDVGGVKEAIFDGMGETVPFGDMDALEESVKKYLTFKEDLSLQMVTKCREYNNKKRMTEEYVLLYKEYLS